ncbi:DUF2076 domain-containing protein [Skermanella rosea]|uniref:DUF2076 domain-containing protein n=1 Tax=Skermanella rosea TaxID=1817965 RepID=UPI0019338422|nr:DUF2076 domain-containing protein [Skermanella rosea]UEM05955.1 DUF2076 domain-containing protein [Skermanella rosea]
MDQNERQIIEELFGKLRQAEAQSGPRDGQAESFIREQVTRQPAAPYLMAQAIVIQEQALAASQARIQELEQELQSRPASGGGGLFGSLFGGGSQQRQPAPPSNSPWGSQRQAVPPGDPRVAAYANPQYQQRQGGGFMAGAMQTAMGVAGGMLIGNALGSMFSSGEAMAEDAVGAVEEQVPEDFAADDGGDFFGGDEEL